MCLLIEILQNSCKKITIQDFSEYDLTKGKIISSIIKVKSPGQEKWKTISFITGGTTLIDNKILEIQKNLSDTISDLLEGYYEFKITVIQSLNGVETINTETFCYFNSCNIDCKIDQLKLDILSNKCCEDLECQGKLSSSYSLLETLKLYRDGIKASAELCKKQTVLDLYKCLKSKLEIEDVNCKCK